MDRGPSRGDVWIATILGLVVCAAFGPFAAAGLDPHHDGIMLKPALDVLSGQILFRDTFTQYGPLTTYLQALSLWVWPRLITLKYLTVGAYAGSLFFLYLGWRVFAPKSICLVAAFFFVVYAPFYNSDAYFPMLPWSSVLALFFQSIAFFVVMALVCGASGAAWSWLLGVSLACTLCCRQTVGLATVGSLVLIGVTLVLFGWRPKHGSVARMWIRTAMGFFSVTCLVFGHLAIEGALGEWWEQNILWPQRWASGVAWGKGVYLASQHLSAARTLGLIVVSAAIFLPLIARRFYNVLPRWLGVIWISLLGLLYLCFGASVRPSLLVLDGGWNGMILLSIIFQSIWVFTSLLGEKIASRRLDLYILGSAACLGAGAAAQIFPIPEPSHLFWALAPSFGAFFYLFWRLGGASQVASCLMFAFLLAPGAYDQYRWASYTLQRAKVELQSPSILRGIRVSRGDAIAYKELDDALQVLQRPDPARPVLLFGGDALYLTFFRNLTNPSPYYVTWAALGSSEDRARRLAFIIQYRPILLLHGQREESLPPFLEFVGYKIVYRERSPGMLCVALPVGESSAALDDRFAQGGDSGVGRIDIID